MNGTVASPRSPWNTAGSVSLISNGVFQRLSANTVLMMDSNIDETSALACLTVEPLEYVEECDIGFHWSSPCSPHGLAMAKARTARSQWSDEPCGP